MLLLLLLPPFPALAWALIGDPTPLLVLLGSAALALLLRQRSEWSLVVMATAPLGLVFALVLMATLQAPLQQLKAGRTNDERS